MKLGLAFVTLSTIGVAVACTDNVMLGRNGEKAMGSDDAGMGGAPNDGTGGADTGGASTGGAGTGGASGGAGAMTGGSGGRLPIPNNDGVPVGDCTDPTPAEQTAHDCPIEEPAPMSPCHAPFGTICRYDIHIDQSSTALQNYYSCSADDGTWGPGAQIPCGLRCGAPLANVTELAKTCSSRPITRCEAGSDTLFAYPTAQQWLDDAFLRVLRACDPQVVNKFIQVELVDGCPTRLSSNVRLDPSFEACVVNRLNQVKWDCALELQCSVFSQFLI